MQNDLIERLEAATAEQQHQLLETAYAALNGGRLFDQPASPNFGVTYGRWRRFKAMLQAEAYESAALTLVPEGWTRDVDATAPECGIAVTLHGPDKQTALGDHESEPIATVIAALRARP